MKKLILSLIVTLTMLFSCEKPKEKDIKTVMLFDRADIKSSAQKHNYSEDDVKVLIIKEFQKRIDSLLKIKNPTKMDNYAIYQHLANLDILVRETNLPDDYEKELSIWVKEKAIEINN